MKYFGTDGIRGKAYQELTLSLAYRLGVALNVFEADIIIGIDTRFSSLDLAKALFKGINNSKKVKFAGVIPTSGLIAYSLNHQSLAVMITASHNPYQDNGFKIIDKGSKLSEQKQLLVEKIIDDTNEENINLDFDLVIDESILNEYYQLLDNNFYKSKYKVLFDAAHGCYSKILDKYHFDVINNNPNGFNINENCGSTDVTNLIQKVKEENYDYGIAFDGDGDRIILVDCFNRIYNGDFILYLFAIELKKQNLLLGNTVVVSEMTNPGILERFDTINIQYITTPVGDINISKAMVNGYVLGGEPSGHIINNNIIPFGDGLINAFYLLKILDNINLNNEYQKVSMYFSINYNLVYKAKSQLDFYCINKIVKKYSNSNQILIIRKSGTEKVIRITLFQKSKVGLDKKIKLITRKVSRCIIKV